jgi:hypothetical protein
VSLIQSSKVLMNLRIPTQWVASRVENGANTYLVIIKPYHAGPSKLPQP